MNEKDTADAFLTLALDIGERAFSDLPELEEWVNNERAEFSWLATLANRDGNATRGWRVIEEWLSQMERLIRECNKVLSDEASLRNVKNKFKNSAESYYQTRAVKSSASSDAQFVFELRRKYSEEIAGHALNFLMAQEISPTLPEALEGAFWALHYKRGILETVDAQRQALEILKRGWANRLGKQHGDFKQKQKELTEEIAELRNNFLSLTEEIRQQQSDQKNQFDELFSDVNKELANIAKTYDEKLALQSSVRYWYKKKDQHQKVLEYMALITLVVAATTGVFFYAASQSLLTENVTQIPLWKLSSLLAISTAGIWLTRICTKIFISNLHLRTDADERVTMMLTYLALLRKGNGPKEDDRQLILQTLFRPSSTGFIKEDGPVGLSEVISKGIGR